MRKVTFGVANSLDHFIARSDQAVDWLIWSDETTALMTDFWKDIDTIVMGRKTYEVALQKSAGSGGDSPCTAMQTYVLSRSLEPDPERDKGAEIVAGDAVEFLGNLKEQDGKDIFLMGGGELAQPLFEAGLIDELGLNIHPLLLGSGVPLFRGFEKEIDLELIKCDAFESGCVNVLYRVVR